MEFILIISVIAVLCIIFQVSTDIIIMFSMILVFIVFAVTTLLFIWFFICLLCSEKSEAEFSRIGKSGKNKFGKAYYIVDGVEYPCIFPEEKLFGISLYKKDRKYHVWLNRRMKFVYDRFATATCILGFLTSISLIVITVIGYLNA